jgi:hypothetical protein
MQVKGELTMMILSLIFVAFFLLAVCIFLALDILTMRRKAQLLAVTREAIARDAKRATLYQTALQYRDGN